eukprot:scaffold115_cov241-Pinguiococcus_pyrenoidosus.AAC.12
MLHPIFRVTGRMRCWTIPRRLLPLVGLSNYRNQDPPIQLESFHAFRMIQLVDWRCECIKRACDGENRQEKRRSQGKAASASRCAGVCIYGFTGPTALHTLYSSFSTSLIRLTISRRLVSWICGVRGTVSPALACDAFDSFGLYLSGEDEFIQDGVHLVKIEDDVQLADVAEVLVQERHEEVDPLEGAQLVLIRVHSKREVQAGVLPGQLKSRSDRASSTCRDAASVLRRSFVPVHKLVVVVLDEVGELPVSAGDESMNFRLRANLGKKTKS